MDINISNTLQIVNEVEFISNFTAKELTVENPKFVEAVNAGRSTWGIQPVIKNFYIEGTTFHLPRGYLDRLVQVAKLNNIKVKLNDQRSFFGNDYIKHAHTIIPRDYQYEALLNMSKYTEGVLVAPAGSGKTIMGIALIIMSGQNVLWITHTDVLANQFIDRVNQFITNLKSKDIGNIRSGKWGVGNKITVSLVQTLVRSLDKVAEMKDNFGMVIIDEAHHCPATTFTKVVSNLNPYYLYGLTATPNRRDKLEQVLFQNIGPIRHIVPRSEVAKGNRVITPHVKVINLEPLVNAGNNYQDIVKALVHDEARNKRIVSDIAKESLLGNICIVVTDRIIHAEVLLETLQKENLKVGIATGHYNKDFRKTTLKDLINGVINILVCTTHLIGEGFDYPALNRLFLCLPFRDENKCEQVTGRVQRPCEGKTDAIIYDYVDNHGLLKHQFKNSGAKGCRYNVYIKLGCTIGD